MNMKSLIMYIYEYWTKHMHLLIHMNEIPLSDFFTPHGYQNKQIDAGPRWPHDHLGLGW